MKLQNINSNEKDLIRLLKMVLQTLLSMNSAAEQNTDKIAIVGGWVRDKILNKESNDIDIVVHKNIYESYKDLLILKLRNKGIKVEIKKIELKNKVKKGKIVTNLKFNFKRIPIDLDLVTMSGDSYRADHLKRDFTVNAIYYDIESEKIIDYCGGITHIQEKLLKTVH